MWTEDVIQPYVKRNCFNVSFHLPLLTLYFCRFLHDSHVFVGAMDVHPTQDAIVVHYEVEAIVLNEYGEPAVADRKSAQKV